MNSRNIPMNRRSKHNIAIRIAIDCTPSAKVLSKAILAQIGDSSSEGTANGGGKEERNLLLSKAKKREEG